MTEQKKYGGARKPGPDLKKVTTPESENMKGQEVIDTNLFEDVQTGDIGDAGDGGEFVNTPEDVLYSTDNAVQDISRIIDKLDRIKSDKVILAIGKLRGAIIKLQG